MKSLQSLNNVTFTRLTVILSMEKPKAEKFKTATIKTRIWTKVLVIEDKLERKLYEGMGEITRGFRPEIWGKYSFIRFDEGFV